MMAIYKITNLTTADFYIGSTNNFKRRKYEHFGELRRNKNPCKVLQSAYNKYGKSAFVMEVLEEVDSESNLIEREQHYIDTLKPMYNIRLFAKSGKGFNLSQQQIENLIAITSKCVVQYDKNWRVVGEYKSIAEASRILKLNAGNIGSCCNGSSKSCGGFFFQFKGNPKPYKYSSRRGNIPKEYTITWPDGKKDVTINISQYCKDNNLDITHLRYCKRYKKQNKYNLIITKNSKLWERED